MATLLYLRVVEAQTRKKVFVIDFPLLQQEMLLLPLSQLLTISPW